VVVGKEVYSRPLAAFGIVIAVALLYIAAQYGAMGVAVVFIAALPWFTVLLDLLPPLVRSVSAGFAAVAVAVASVPRARQSRNANLLRLAIGFLSVPAVISLTLTPGSQQVIQALKYAVFPIAAVAVVAGTGRARLTKLRRIGVFSAGGALLFQLLAGASGIGHIGTYYGSGEILGFSSPHESSLLAVVVAAAVLGGDIRGRWRVVLLGIATVAAVGTGVRAGLLALALVFLVNLMITRARVRAFALLGLVVAAVFASGVSSVLATRIAHSQQTGEFNSVSTAGSGRGAIWTAAYHHFLNSSPPDKVVGTGLRSVKTLTEEKLGTAFVGHSDVIEVGVDLGLAGLIGLGLAWVALARSTRARLPLVGLFVFGLANGALEYSSPVVLCMLMATGTSFYATRSPPRRRATGPARP
jgi:hypothetical protein